MKDKIIKSNQKMENMEIKFEQIEKSLAPNVSELSSKVVELLDKDKVY